MTGPSTHSLVIIGYLARIAMLIVCRSHAPPFLSSQYDFTLTRTFGQPGSWGCGCVLQDYTTGLFCRNYINFNKTCLTYKCCQWSSWIMMSFCSVWYSFREAGVQTTTILGSKELEADLQFQEPNANLFCEFPQLWLVISGCSCSDWLHFCQSTKR